MTYPEPRETSKIEQFGETFNGWKMFDRVRNVFLQRLIFINEQEH